ncbi:MAG: SBBP repeat-containing protein, partial [Aquificaceae bacterium]
AVDSFGNVYVAGYTTFRYFPDTSGEDQSDYSLYENDQLSNAFVAKLTGDLSG